MPARSVIAAIVLFWLAMAGWWFARDIYPTWDLDEPPVYQADLVDEFGVSVVSWTLWSDKPIGIGITQVRRLEPGLFEMSGKLDFTIHEVREGFDKYLMVGMELRHIENKLKVTADGEIQSFSSKMVLRTPLWGDLATEMSGEVKDGLMHPQAIALGQKLELAPYPMPRGGGLVNPMLPSHRIRGLVAGKRWRTKVVSLMGSAPAVKIEGEGIANLGENPLLKSVAMDELEARTFEDQLTWHKEDVPCIRMDTSKPDALRALSRTWVRARDGQVLQMEMNPALSQKILLVRDLPPRHD